MIKSFSDEYRFLSNFWYVDVHLEDDPFTYLSTEHAYQAAKTLNLSLRREISLAATPSIAKAVGREIALRPDWESVKRLVMLNLLREKFGDKNYILQQKLLATGTQKLIEGNHWHDNYWGECTCMACESEKHHNWLGKLLMLVRLETQIRMGI